MSKALIKLKSKQEALEKREKAMKEKLKKDKKIDLQADRTLDYGFVVDIMAIMRRAGIEQVGMLTEPPPEEK